MYLLDTNIWLERLLDQEHSDDVGRLLNEIPLDQLFISDFSFHSICLILARVGQTQTLIEFAQDLFVNGGVGLLAIRPEEISAVIDAIDNLSLDFDDAYQYAIARNNNLVIVSFDSDFDNLPLSGKTPAQVLASL